MIPHTRSLPFTGLRAVHNARTRIFAAGSDPLFRRESLARARIAAPTAGTRPAAPELRLWRRDLLDRLQPPVTRYRE